MLCCPRVQSANHFVGVSRCLRVRTCEFECNLQALVTKLHAFQSAPTSATLLRTASVGVVLDRVNAFSDASSAAILGAAAEAARASPEDDLLHAQLLLSLSTDLLAKARHTNSAGSHSVSRVGQGASDLFGGSAIVGN